MILQIGPESSTLIRAAAATILLLHISGGMVGLVSGAVALIARKGGGLHRFAGHVFFVSMLVMSAIGAGVSPFLHKRLDPLVGAFTFYLVATAWATVRRKAGTTGRFEIGACAMAFAIVAASVTFGLQASPADDNPPTAYYVFAALVALAALLDLKMILRGGLCGAARIARHLWRMCLALGIAASSLFLGQQQLFPASLRGSFLLFVPEIIVLGAMAFWLLRVRSTHGRSTRAPLRGGGAVPSEPAS
ncbi:MAG TPA: hypothetical protein VGC55_03335 [Dokdonella sp.]